MGEELHSEEKNKKRISADGLSTLYFKDWVWSVFEQLQWGKRATEKQTQNQKTNKDEGR